MTSRLAINHSWSFVVFVCMYIFSSFNVSFLCVMHYNRNNSTVVEEFPPSILIWRSQISVLLSPLRVASKTAFATVKLPIDGGNSSTTVLLFLNYNTKKEELSGVITHILYSKITTRALKTERLTKSAFISVLHLKVCVL